MPFLRPEDENSESYSASVGGIVSSVRPRYCMVVGLRNPGLQSLILTCQASVVCLDPRMFGDTVEIDGYRYTILW